MVTEDARAVFMAAPPSRDTLSRTPAVLSGPSMTLAQLFVKPLRCEK